MDWRLSQLEIGRENEVENRVAIKKERNGDGEIENRKSESVNLKI